MILATTLLGVILSSLMTAWMRRYALSARLLDHPNERSSHSIATPRGGGVAIVLSFLVIAGAMAWLRVIEPDLLMALAGSGGLVAVVGFLDDQHAVPAAWRFCAHSAAAAWCLWLMGGHIPPVPVFGTSLDLGWIGLVIAATYLVWMINLCNFMDGIDGIASVEAITVSLGGALCWWVAAGTPQWQLPVIFAGCVAGFLVWNYPPAKIFMGDAGSGFLGMVLGLFSLWAGHQEPQVFWCWFILLGCFMVDATTTLIRRVRRGGRLSVAHRCHAYQYASRKHRSHRRVTVAFGLINLLWLLPIALIVAARHLDGAAAVVLAYAPLVALAFNYKAGDPASQEG